MRKRSRSLTYINSKNFVRLLESQYFSKEDFIMPESALLICIYSSSFDLLQATKKNGVNSSCSVSFSICKFENILANVVLSNLEGCNDKTIEMYYLNYYLINYKMNIGDKQFRTQTMPNLSGLLFKHFMIR